MSETLLETAQNTTEAGSSTTTAAAATTVATGTGTQQTTSSEQSTTATTPAAETAKTETQQTTETAKTETAKTEAAKVEGAPEKYDFKAPDGQSYDPQVLTAFGEAARTANLTQDAAQKLIDAMAPKLAARRVEQVTAIHKEWANTVLSDKEIGGEVGSDQFKQKMGVAKKFVTQFDQDGAFGKLLEDTGLGNHPAVLRVLYRAGKAISEDTIVTRGNREGGQVNPLDVLYPTSKKE